jgi:hypothetical protein
MIHLLILVVHLLAPIAKPKWEFPRLCRGGSKSLTYPGVGSLAPPMRRRLVSRQATRKGVPPMDNHEKLSHTK